jgi:hypothetical protein
VKEKTYWDFGSFKKDGWNIIHVHRIKLDAAQTISSRCVTPNNWIFLPPYLGWIYVVHDEHIELLGNKHGIYDCIIKTLLTGDDIQLQVFPALALSRCISCTTLPSWTPSPPKRKVYPHVLDTQHVESIKWRRKKESGILLKTLIPCHPSLTCCRKINCWINPIFFSEINYIHFESGEWDQSMTTGLPVSRIWSNWASSVMGVSSMDTGFSSW